MATLKSLYSSAVSAVVPTDTLSPKPPTVGTVNGTQSTSGEAKGKSVITINWTIPTENELVTELLGVATGSAQNLESRFDPIVAASEIVYEVTDQSPGGGGSTTLFVAATKDDDKITVTLATDFAVGEWIQIDEGAETHYYKIAAINSSVFDLTSRINVDGGFTTSATVKEVTVSAAKSDPTDYSLADPTGVFSLESGQFTNTNHVIVQYTTTLQDLGHFELYRVAGNKTVSPSAGHSKVTIDAVIAATEVVVENNIADDTTQYAETLTASENGNSWTYYLFASDDETSSNDSFAMEHDGSEGLFIEMLPGIPQSLSTTVGDEKVVLSWSDIQAGSENDNANGYNVLRDDGNTFEDSTSEIVNSSLIAVTGGSSVSFEDSIYNVTNRVDVGTLAYPVNGSSYSYKVESEDTATSWATGTYNESATPNNDGSGGTAIR